MNVNKKVKQKELNQQTSNNKGSSAKFALNIKRISEN